MTYTSIFNPLLGRGAVEQHVVSTIGLWLVTYLAEYERQNGLAPRTIPVPPTPESISAGVDPLAFEQDLLPQIITVVQPTGEAERWDGGTYGQWYDLELHAIVYVEGSQNGARQLADAYGTALQGLLAQQGGLGVGADGTTPFATRTRLWSGYGVDFPDETVRDIVRASLAGRTFVENLVSDLYGPRTPPADPYATPAGWPEIDEIDIAILRGTPGVGYATADEAVVDATVVPEELHFGTGTVYNPLPGGGIPPIPPLAPQPPVPQPPIPPVPVPPAGPLLLGPNTFLSGTTLLGGGTPPLGVPLKLGAGTVLSGATLLES